METEPHQTRVDGAAVAKKVMIEHLLKGTFEQRVHGEEEVSNLVIIWRMDPKKRNEPIQRFRMWAEEQGGYASRAKDKGMWKKETQKCNK